MKKNLIISLLTVILLLVIVFLAFDLHRRSKEEVFSQFNEHQLLVVQQITGEIESYLRARSQGIQVLSSFASLQSRFSA